MIPNLSLNRQTYIRKLKQKKFRRSEETFICEGFRLFDTARQTPGIIIREIIIGENLEGTQQERFFIEEAVNHAIPVFRVENNVLKSLSQEVTPSGILFTVKKKLLTRQDLSARDDVMILYLDRISDPGNLGTIIRTTAWFGFNAIVLSPGCVDPLNAKSVRASAGAVFNMDLFEDIEFNWFKLFFKNRKYQFIATTVSGGQPLEQWKMESKNIIFFGQEATGLSQEIIQAADSLLRIQRVGRVESLNLSVAAGIILHHFAVIK